MRRGTTPTLKVKVKGIKLERLASIYLTLKQHNNEVTKTKEEMTIEENNILSCPLSQEDTLKFSMGYVYIQIRAVTDDGVAVASNIEQRIMQEILKGGIIE